MLQLYQSTMSHELLTPLKCISQLTANTLRKNVNQDTNNDLNLI